MRKKEPKERGQPWRARVPLAFDEAMTRVVLVKPPPDGDYKKANEKRARHGKKR